MRPNFKSKNEIKAEVDIVDYALVNGYVIDKEKSTQNWVKMLNETTGDRILVKPKSALYNNIDYPNDKGDILQFVANRITGVLSVDKSNEAFYKSMLEINKYLGNHLNAEKRKVINEKDKFFTKKETLSSLQNSEWNHKPIEDYSYLTNDRGINIDVLKGPLFQDKLFNTYFRLSNDHIITNYAFGKYSNNDLVGLEVRNKNIKTIMGDHDGVFYTNTKNMDKIDGVFYGESGIDLASCIELLYATPTFDRSKNYCFLSFSGNLYESKMNKIIEDLKRLPLTQSAKFISLTDNDFDKDENKKPGKIYDVFFTASLINEFKTPLAYSENETFFNYTFDKEKGNIDIEKLNKVVENQNQEIEQLFNTDQRYGKYLILKESEAAVTLHIPKNITLENAHFNSLLKVFDAERFYIAHKPKSTNDWNEELQRRKGLIKEEKKNLNLTIINKPKSHGKRI